MKYQSTGEHQIESKDFSQLAAKEPIIYRVEGQKALKLTLQAGDQFAVKSGDGAQCCELLVQNEQGLAAPELLLSHGNTPSPSLAEGILSQLDNHREAQTLNCELSQQLNQWGITNQHLNLALCIPGSQQNTLFTATEALQVVITAPGTDMPVGGPALSIDGKAIAPDHWPLYLPCTEIEVSVFPLATTERLPEPLAPVKQEIRVSRATARSYQVKAGEWIQIIDVSGKQCSDFVAFDQNALEEGKELPLDAVATRTVQGLSYPVPGLHSRFMAEDLQAMVEVVQDTVGRHDSFLLACSAKYYDDSGYFGHISCSDNFNQVLTPLGIQTKTAWPAINFFFNTGVEPCGSVFMDEPWSRAGDYVLLRANRDLLCASSACPDDIDPANGWCPTDIHIRIYGAEHQFPRALAHRLTPEEPPRMTKTTGFHPRIQALSQKLVEYKGYWVASEYDGWGARSEYLACRERVAMIDLSPLRKFEVLGPDAEAFLNYVLTRNVRRLAIGEIAYSAICQETGGMIDDGTVFRMAEQAFRWVCGDPYTGEWMRQQAEKQGFRVNIRNSSDQLHNLAVQGPESRNLLSELIWTPEAQPSLSKLAWFHFLIGRIGGPDGIPVLVSRTGYTGELGYEVWCHPKDAEQVWDAIWQTGQAYQIAPLGFDALDMLRIEAGLIFAEHEFCPETNPYEAGIGFTVPMKTKTDDFIGKTAMAQQTPESRHKLVGLELEGNEAATHGDPVYQGRFPVGVITSATPSPLLNKQIALCRVAPAYAKPDTELEVGQLDGLKKRLPAKVVSLPFYDPERTRVRS